MSQKPFNPLDLAPAVWIDMDKNGELYDRLLDETGQSSQIVAVDANGNRHLIGARNDNVQPDHIV